jgi:hypothetical protein
MDRLRELIIQTRDSEKCEIKSQFVYILFYSFVHSHIQGLCTLLLILLFIIIMRSI